MSAPPKRPGSSPSPAEMQILLAPTGLALNPGQVADLVLAWRQLAGLIAAIPRDRPLADDQAFAFRLAPPPAPRAPAAAIKPKATKKKRAAPARKTARARR